MKFSFDETYINIRGYAVLFSSMPCSKCKMRYHIGCPHYDWCIKEKANTYTRMTLYEIWKSKGIRTFKEAINSD